MLAIVLTIPLALGSSAPGLALGQQEPPAAATGEHQGHVHPGGGQRVERLGDPLQIPDVAVRNQDGDELHFLSDVVDDKVVAINFVFTTCTTICPPMGANFGQLQSLLGDALDGNVGLISVSVDPTRDTPERLKAWGARFGAEAGWTLVTGAKEEIDGLLKSLRVFTSDFEQHAPIALVGSEATGTWVRVNGLAKPQTFVDLIAEIEAQGSAVAP